MNLRKILISATALLALNGSAATTSTIERAFAEPPFEAKPWCFWYWMFGAVTEEGIKADLEAMKRIGLGGTYLMPIKSVDKAPEYEGKAPQLSPQWWHLVGRSMEIADSLDLKLGMHICDGFALAGGPWISPEESMQKVVSADTIVGGGVVENLILPVPESYKGYYEDISLLAMPVKGVKIAEKPIVTVENIDNGQVAAGKGGNIDDKGVIRSSVACRIQYEYSKPVTVSNIEVILSGNNYQAHRLKVFAGDDGKTFREVKQLTPARHGWQNTDEQSTYAIPRTTARYFRFTWTPVGSEPGSEDLDAAKWKPNLKIKDIVLSGEPKLNQWEGKAGLVWRVAEPTADGEVPESLCVKTGEIIDLTSQMRNGVLSASLPKGEWRIVRLGHTSTGHTNATGGAGQGLETDKFSREAVAKQFDNWFGRVFRETDSNLAKRVLKYMHIDSWECGSQNWSRNFASEFKSRRGYDLMPYMPLFAGIPVDDVATSERVLRDVRLTAAELVVDVFYDVLAEKAREYDCLVSAECVSPTMVSDGMLHYQAVDFPMGEYWLRSPTHDKPNDMLDAIHGGHIYGKNIIQAEGFTEVRGTWDETPAMLKTLLDRNYALGINRMFYHVNTHNPYLDKKPGMTLDGIGLFFQRDNTWWNDGGRGLTDYMRRVQAMLQYGTPVTDIAVFTGEEIPRRAVLPDRLVSSLPGIFGQERVDSERKRLANDGQPLRVMPVGVTHSANMADPDKWINPMRGYNYDSMNKDALLRLAKAENGRVVLPGGASYRVLVLPLASPLMPDTVLSPEVKAKVASLVKAGVVVPQLPYTADDFSTFGLQRDLIVPENVAWNHRRHDGDNVDSYFISNQEERSREFTASFRIAGRVPELWNPMTGTIDKNLDWKIVDGGSRTEVRLSLDAAESTFIVFREPTTAVSGTAPAATKSVSDLKTKGGWTVEFVTTGERVESDTLFDWTDSERQSIKYYSGTAVYTSSFKAPSVKKGDKVTMNLDGLHDVATVTVNGKECGIVWTAPYTVDITDAVKKGQNQLCISVTNTWANAILGADEGKAPFDGIWTNAKYRRAEKTLLPAGLTGPISITVTRNK